MFAHGIPIRKPGSGTAALAMAPWRWLTASALVLAAFLAVAAVAAALATASPDAGGDPLTLPEQTRSMIIVPMRL